MNTVTTHPTEYSSFAKSPWRRRIRFTIYALYLAFATTVSLWAVRYAPTEGGPMAPFFPKDRVLVLHLKDGDAAWRALEAQPGLQALWAHKELQRKTHWAAKLSEKRDELDKCPELLRDLFFLSLDRRGLRFLTGGEVTAVLQPTPSSPPTPQMKAPAETKPQRSAKVGRAGQPLVLYFRLQGGRGALARLAAPWALRRNSNITWNDLGGGLIALGLQGGKPALPETGLPASTPSEPLKPNTFAELLLTPPSPSEEIAQAPLQENLPPESDKNETDQAHIPVPAPGKGDLPQAQPGGNEENLQPKNENTETSQNTFSWAQTFKILGFQTVPTEVRIGFSPLKEKTAEENDATPGFEAAGLWKGPLPQLETPAPLVDPGLPADTLPLLDALLPLDAQAAFTNWMESEQRSGVKLQRRWEARMTMLADDGVDLERDLWPAMGKTLHLAIMPPSEDSATKQGSIVFSLPFQGQTVSRGVLEELAGVCWNGLFDKTPPEGTRRPYVRRLTKGPLQRYILVKGSFTRPMLLVSDKSLSFINDGGPLSLTPAAPGLAPPPSVSAEKQALPTVHLKVDGRRLAPHLALLTQSWLEDSRDTMGVAKFMEKYPDEEGVINLVETLIQFCGDFSIKLKPDEEQGEKNKGRISARWRPQP